MTRRPPEQATAWRGELEKLVANGADGAYAIRNFLEQNTDIRFDGVDGAEQLGYSSVRLALIDALQAIGGSEAMQVRTVSRPALLVCGCATSQGLRLMKQKKPRATV